MSSARPLLEKLRPQRQSAAKSQLVAVLVGACLRCWVTLVLPRRQQPLPLCRLAAPYQACSRSRLNGSMSGRGSRRRFEKTALAELANSIREKGIVQPILVRPDPKKMARYQLVAGERRWRAAQLAQLHQVPAIIRNLDDADCYEIALVENIQRTDLTVIEEAQGYKSLLDTNRYTQDQLSKIIGKSRSHIANLMRLISLPDAVQTLILDRQLSMGQARPLIGHADAEKLSHLIVAKGLSARQVETLVKTPTNDRKSPKKREKSANIEALEKRAAADWAYLCRSTGMTPSSAAKSRLIAGL